MSGGRNTDGCYPLSIYVMASMTMLELKQDPQLRSAARGNPSVCMPLSAEPAALLVLNTPEPFLEHSMKLSYTAAVRLPLSLRRLFLLFF